MSTEQSAESSWRMMSEMSTMPLSSKSMPLMAESALAPGATEALIAGISGLRNWWGRQKQTIVAPSTAFSSDGSATTLGVNLAPLRYLTFSLVSLMIWVSGLPSIISSCTYMVTVGSNSGFSSAFLPRMRTSAEPKLPEPIMAIFSLPAVEYMRAAARHRGTAYARERTPGLAPCSDAVPASPLCADVLRWWLVVVGGYNGATGS
mmetsp:Transcript_5874/g.13671  ORF Transcript_5874/g.13671 Transcript_5874/m.13671 type:complete len:205 (-) Transcript_5874:126-740(-)